MYYLGGAVELSQSLILTVITTAVSVTENVCPVMYIRTAGS